MYKQTWDLISFVGLIMDQLALEQERLEILRRYRHLIEVWHTRKDTADRWMVRKAFRVAADAHKDMRRKTGEPFIYHPLAVATIAAEEIGLGRTSIIAALLHDTVEDTDLRLSDVTAMFGNEVARIIDGLTKIDEISDTTSSAQAETLKKILYTLSDDVRVILIKLADRLHNMRTMEVMPREKQLKIASETSFIYSPLAHRLGLFSIKSELEEMSFKYAQPKLYRDLKEKLNDRYQETMRFFEVFRDPFEKELKSIRLKSDIECNIKTAFAVWKKMKENGVPFEEVFGTFGVDVVINTKVEREKRDCWAAYAVLTSIYKPNIKSLRDWMSSPKANGYEAIHITVMGPGGQWVDVHIRSKRMDEIARKGYAAYWKYKDQKNIDAGLDDWLDKTRELLKESDEETFGFIDDFKRNLFADEVVVFTPQGRMVNLPLTATVLDFAYSIHTDLGNSCIGANVNHRLVPVDYELKSGDQIEIITSRIQQPNEDWYKYVVTARAKSRIKLAIKNDRKKFREEGKQKLDDYFSQLKMEPSKARINTLIKASGLVGQVDLFYYIAKGKIEFKDVKEVLSPSESRVSWMRGLRLPFIRPKSSVAVKKEQDENIGEGVPVEGNKMIAEFRDLDYSVSKCCNPIPGDNVIGIVFPNEPIQIHRTDCEQAIGLMAQFGKNIVKAKWKQKEGIAFLAGLKIQAVDKIGLIQEVSARIAEDFKLNIRTFNLKSSEGLVDLSITLYVKDTESLKELIQKLKKIKEVIKITRIDRIG